MSFIQLWSQWEVRVLVILSFSLQVTLLFSGVRRRNVKPILNLLLWLTYLLADFVASYTLGYISHSKEMNDWQIHQMVGNSDGGHVLNMDWQLVVLWAPFLLIHLGGQDTITAFAIEDNELWTRHMLNLVVQGCMVFYIMLKSVAMGGKYVLPLVLLFFAGILKYAERIQALRGATRKSLKNFVEQHRDPEQWRQLYYVLLRGQEHIQPFSQVMTAALPSFVAARDLFSGLGISMWDALWRGPSFAGMNSMMAYGVMDVELALIYEDLYTKAPVVKTTVGIIVRGIVFLSTFTAFILFMVSSKGGYHRVDIMITYVLFLGGFLVELCAIFLMFLSARSWAYLQYHNCHRLASAVLFVLEHLRPGWSNSMGQYNLVKSCLTDQRSRSSLLSKGMQLIGAHEWWSNLQQTEHVPLSRSDLKDRIFMELISINHDVAHENWRHSIILHGNRRQAVAVDLMRRPFEEVIFVWHIATDICFHLDDANSHPNIAEMSNELSNYMMFLLVARPLMLPFVSARAICVDTCAAIKRELLQVGNLEDLREVYRVLLNDRPRVQPIGTALRQAVVLANNIQANFGNDKWNVIFDIWLKLVCYAAGKSNSEMHAKQLSNGGELITFVWLLMAHLGLGDQRERLLQFVPQGANNHGAQRRITIFPIEPPLPPPELE